jgi:hypothetical protein
VRALILSLPFLSSLFFCFLSFPSFHFGDLGM